MFTAEAEHICKMVDQRNADQAVVRKLERMAEPPTLFWTGSMTVSNRRVAIYSGSEPLKLEDYVRASARSFRAALTS